MVDNGDGTTLEAVDLTLGKNGGVLKVRVNELARSFKYRHIMKLFEL